MDADLGLPERTWPIAGHQHVAGAHGVTRRESAMTEVLSGISIDPAGR
jgi:hypothetical protein